MGTDRHENDIRRKGRPAGRKKEGTNLRDALAVNEVDQEKRVSDSDLKHPNRNPDKGEQN